MVHGDLNPEQVFIHNNQAYFVDFDGVATSHPALDLANFLISLKARYGTDGQLLGKYFTEIYLSHAPHENLEGLRVYHALIYFRRAMICFRQKLIPSWASTVRELLYKSEMYLNEPSILAA